MTALASAPARSSAALAPWGMMAVVDLHDADPERLADPDTIRAFVADVVAGVARVAGRTRVDHQDPADASHH